MIFFNDMDQEGRAWGTDVELNAVAVLFIVIVRLLRT